MSPGQLPERGRKLWLVVELVLFAAIVTGLLLVLLGTTAPSLPRSAGYLFIAAGFFCIIGIEVYLAVRSPLP